MIGALQVRGRWSAYASSALPLTVLVFVGSYFGIWKRQPIKVPGLEVLGLFFALWAITAILLALFRAMLSDQDEVIRSAIGNLWGPLILGVIAGRSLMQWRRNKRSGRAPM